MAYEALLFEKKDGVAIITLNSPDKHERDFHRDEASIAAACDEVDKDETIKVAILTGAGRGFCAGHDISEMAAGTAKAPTTYDLLNTAIMKPVSTKYKNR